MVTSPSAVPQFLVVAVSRLTAHALPQYDNYNAISYISGTDAQATILEEENNPNGGLGNYNYRWVETNTDLRPTVLLFTRITCSRDNLKITPDW